MKKAAPPSEGQGRFILLRLIARFQPGFSQISGGCF